MEKNDGSTHSDLLTEEPTGDPLLQFSNQFTQTHYESPQRMSNFELSSILNKFPDEYESMITELLGYEKIV
jgi:hypothetical protein